MTGAAREIAHRGYAGVAPENTLGAFRAVADGRHPADMIEFDVIPSAEGTPVVFHDLRLDGRGHTYSRGVTDGSGIVWETPLSSIRNARVLGTAERVPTLAEVVEALPPSVGLNVELRNPGSFDVRFGELLHPDDLAAQRDLWDPYVHTVIETLEAGDHEVLLSSFFDAAIASARDIAPDRPVGVNVHDSIEDGLGIVERHECEAIHPRRNMIRGTPFFEQSYGSVTDPSFGDADVVATAHDLGADVNVWTVTTWRHAAAFVAAGVDGLIADYPGLLSGWDGTET